MNRSKSTQQMLKRFPININEIRSVRTITGDVNWSQINLVPNVLYHSPRTSVIDFFFLSSNFTLVLIQLTTAKRIPSHKLKSLKLLMDKISKIHPNWRVIGWFISLFPISRDEKTVNDNIIITSGEELKKVIGEIIYEKLIMIKAEL